MTLNRLVAGLVALVLATAAPLAASARNNASPRRDPAPTATGAKAPLPAVPGALGRAAQTPVARDEVLGRPTTRRGT